jgi:hypothetical protein
MDLRFCDEHDDGFGWIAAEPETMRRASQALRARDGVWLVDPVDGDGLDGRIEMLGRPAGVIQLLDRHNRDCAAVAERYGVPLHVTPFDGVTGSPFQFVRALRAPGWKEVALWWPERRVLVVAESLGTASYFRAPGEAVGVHPIRRLAPPRSLARFDAEHVLFGHGEGLHGPDAAGEVRRAIETARRRTPAWMAGLIRNR